MTPDELLGCLISSWRGARRGDGARILEPSRCPMATTRTISDEDLVRLPKDGNKHEVVDGELRVSPAGSLQEFVVARLIARLLVFVEPRELGYVFASNMLYVLPSGNKRCPDVSFVAKGRFAGGRLPRGFFEGSPDLAIEVLSPDDHAREVLDKVGEYLGAGVRLVWVIDPERRRAAVHRSLTEVREIPGDGALAGEDVLPGFVCPLVEFLE
jgi:Uma2 family endonuclease